MFSAMGTKAIMLNNLNRSKRSGVNVFEAASQSGSAASVGSLEDGLVSECATPQRKHRKGNYNAIRNHEYLKDMLTNKDHEDSPAGRAIRKVAHCAARYEKGRDQVRISAFETSSIDYDNFRILLGRMFNLEFTEEEFVEVCRLFDANGDQEIDGDEFIVCFTILSNIEKDNARKRQIKRRQQDHEVFLEIERKRAMEKENYASGVVNYDFSEEDMESAMDKLMKAAHLYDRTHHSARSIKAFEILTMTPMEFRDNINAVFEVVLTPCELGAAVMHYNKGRAGDIKCADFILEFLRIGYEYRMKMRSIQIEKTQVSEKRDKEEKERKLAEQMKKLEERGADMNFDEEDVKSMREKIREIAKGFDRMHPAAPSLGGFDSKYLSPGLFRVSLLNTFKVHLTDKELGALTKQFDTANRGEICNHEFLVYFIRVGYQERCKSRTKQLSASRSAIKKEAEESEKKVMEDWKIDNAKFDPNDYTEDDYHNAIMKISAEASLYHSEHVSSPDLSLFNGADMSVAEFREMLKRQARILLSYQELAALLPEIGSKTQPNMISTSEFIIKFKAMGWKERQKKRSKQLKRIEAEKKAQKKLLEEKREKMTTTLNEIVDYDFEQSDMDSAVEKMTAAAYKYDKNHPSSMSLEAFMGLSMPPGLFGKMVQHTFNVSLTSKELGAIITLYDNNGDGVIDSAEFLSNFFYMQRECRNAVRRRRLEKIKEKEKAKKEEEERRMKRAEEAAKAKLAFTQDDEVSLMEKLADIGQKFAIDNASYLYHLKVFKGPAMNFAAFQTTFFRIFLVKITPAEVGALMNLVNPTMAALRVMDGHKFISVLLRLGRLYEQVLLGKLNPETITYDSLKIAPPPDVRPPSATNNRSPSPIRSIDNSRFPSIDGGSPGFRNGQGGVSEMDSGRDSPSREVIIENDRSVSRGCGPEQDYTQSLNASLPSRFNTNMIELYFKNDDSLSALSMDDSSYMFQSLEGGSVDNLSSVDASKVSEAQSPRRLSPINSRQQSTGSSSCRPDSTWGNSRDTHGMVSAFLGGQNPWGNIDKRSATTRGRSRKRRSDKLKDELSSGLLSPIKGHKKTN
jgi:Ca2+-binding EF-hand superfamily protein